MMDSTYRLGIIGCGGIAKEHARAWSQVPGVSLVTGADLFPESVNRFCEQLKIPGCYTDYREMLSKERLDLVSICTWASAHAEATVAAAEAGVKGVLCEKPMAPDLGQADAMIAACDRHGAKLLVNHQRRSFPVYLKARELIAAGTIGKPVAVTRCTVGGLLNNGSHMVDTIRIMLGDAPVEWVFAQVARKTDRYERGTRIEDFAGATIVFAGGVRAYIEVDTPQPAIPGSTLVTGTDGLLDANEKTLRIMNKDAAGWRDVPVPARDNMVEQCLGLIRWIEGGPEHPASGRINRGTLEILMMIYESARRREPVKPPLQLAKSPLELGIADGSFKLEKPGAYDIRSAKALELAKK